MSATVTNPTVGARPLASTQSRAEALSRFRQILGDDSSLDYSTRTRALYTSDASLYRVEPTVVATPRTREELIRIVPTFIRNR